MKALVIGGERHGEWIDALDGSRMWIDIANACRYVIRKLTWAVTKGDKVLEAYVIHIAVHEQISGPGEQDVVTPLLQSLVMNEFARKHGEPQEIPHEPTAAERLTEGT